MLKIKYWELVKKSLNWLTFANSRRRKKTLNLNPNDDDDNCRYNKASNEQKSLVRNPGNQFTRHPDTIETLRFLPFSSLSIIIIITVPTFDFFIFFSSISFPQTHCFNLYVLFAISNMNEISWLLIGTNLQITIIVI